jgi:hypothetical protein
MASKTFNIEHYKVSFNHEITANWSGTTIHAKGKVKCYGDEYRLIAYFTTDASPLPQPVFLESDKTGVIFCKFNEMERFVDILRHEKPVYAYLNNDKPELTGIGTFREPISERES